MQHAVAQCFISQYSACTQSGAQHESISKDPFQLDGINVCFIDETISTVYDPALVSAPPEDALQGALHSVACVQTCINWRLYRQIAHTAEQAQ